MGTLKKRTPEVSSHAAGVDRAAALTRRGATHFRVEVNERGMASFKFIQVSAEGTSEEVATALGVVSRALGGVLQQAIPAALPSLLPPAAEQPQIKAPYPAAVEEPPIDEVKTPRRQRRSQAPPDGSTVIGAIRMLLSQEPRTLDYLERELVTLKRSPRPTSRSTIASLLYQGAKRGEFTQSGDTWSAA